MKSWLDYHHKLPRWQYLVIGSLLFISTFLAWQVVTALGRVKPFFLPPPGQVLDALIQLFREYGLWADIKASFYRVTVGYLLAVAVAVPLGILMGSFHVFEAIFEPFNGFVRYTPLPAFIPLVILWLGIGDVNQIAIIFLGVFWSLIVMVTDAVSNVPRELLETSYTLGVKRFRAMFSVVLPYSLPGIYNALRVAIGWAWSSLILAEIVGATTGLGHMIMESQRFLRTANVIAGILLVGLLGLLLDLLFKMFHGRLFPWTAKNE